MDRRQTKTRLALYHGFGECLRQRDYSEVTVEDILDKSGISRSTFYAHFKNKEDLLASISRNIFAHVFSHSLSEERIHDFSKDSVLDYRHLFTHIFYHLRDDKDLVQVILKTSCRDAFLQELRKGVDPLSRKIVAEGIYSQGDLPEELACRQVRESFVVAFVYWFERGCPETPETMTAYLFPWPEER